MIGQLNSATIWFVNSEQAPKFKLFLKTAQIMQYFVNLHVKFTEKFPENNSIAIKIVSRSIDFGVLSENRIICQIFSTL